MVVVAIGPMAAFIVRGVVQMAVLAAAAALNLAASGRGRLAAAALGLGRLTAGAVVTGISIPLGFHRVAGIFG